MLAPELGTMSIDSVTPTSLNVKVPILSTGGAVATATICAYTDNAYTTSAGCVTTPTIANDTISGTLTDLTENTTYYVRVIATNAGGSDTVNAIYVSVNNVHFVMKPVQGGTFWMGAQKTDVSGQNYDSNADLDESPEHQVTLSSYYMGETEVTQALWLAVKGSWPGKVPSSEYGSGNNYPAYYVSWNDVQSFISQLNTLTGLTFRLPTEAEWEYAARGGDSASSATTYRFSGSNNIGDVAWYLNNSGSTTHEVGKKQANALGLYDMSGNVREWCSDRYGSYGNDSQTNPGGAALGSDRVNRGGSWGYSAEYCRVVDRSNNAPGTRIYNIGFRLALVQ